MNMYLLANENLGAAMFGIGVLMLIVLLMRRARRYQRKTKRENAKPHRTKLEEARKDTPLIDAPPEILRWQVEMHETARELKAELDSKMSSLQAITRIASEESARLEAAIARAEQLGISPTTDTFDVIERMANGDSAVGTALDEMTMPDKDLMNRQAVFDLADQGLNASAIADSIGAAIGDVELMMSIRHNDPSSGS